VVDPAAGTIQTQELFGAERLFVKGDRLTGAAEDQIRGDAVIALGDRLDRCRR